MNVISLQNIEKSYGTRLLFKDVNITFTTDKRLGLVGINGTGKSTFLKILAAQMEPDKVALSGMVRRVFIIWLKPQSLIQNQLC